MFMMLGLRLCLRLCFVVCAVVLANLVTARPVVVTPGAQAVLNLNGAGYLISTAMPVIATKAKTVTVPTIHGEDDGFYYDVGSIAVTSFDPGLSSVKFNNGTGSLTLILTNAELDVHADWDFEAKVWPHYPKGDGKR